MRLFGTTFLIGLLVLGQLVVPTSPATAAGILGASAEARDHRLPFLRDRRQRFSFTIEISGVEAGYFKGVDGLSAEIEVLEFRDGSDADAPPRRIPGTTRVGDVTLKKGYVYAPELQEWWTSVRSGVVDRRDISIILNDNAGNEVRRWNLYGCWPRQWTVSGFDGKGNDPVTEAITFVVEDIEIN